MASPASPSVSLNSVSLSQSASHVANSTTVHQQSPHLPLPVPVQVLNKMAQVNHSWRPEEDGRRGRNGKDGNGRRNGKRPL